jgi:uncharacterized membrane protein
MRRKYPGQMTSRAARPLAESSRVEAFSDGVLAIGVIWVNHHSLFTRIGRVDTGLLWPNLGLLLTASVLPFPTAELAFAMGMARTATGSAPCCCTR